MFRIAPAAFALIVLPLSVQAQNQSLDIGQMGDRLAGDSDGLSIFVTILCFLIAAVMTFVGIMKLKESIDPRSGKSPVVGIIFILLAAALAALPMTMGFGVSLLFGDGASTLSAGRPPMLNYN